MYRCEQVHRKAWGWHQMSRLLSTSYIGVKPLTWTQNSVSQIRYLAIFLLLFLLPVVWDYRKTTTNQAITWMLGIWTLALMLVLQALFPTDDLLKQVEGIFKKKNWVKYTKSSGADVWVQSNDELEGRLSISQTSRTQVMSRQMEVTKRSKHTV